MLLEADVKGLEVVCAAYLSGDTTLRREILDGVDIHEENRKRFNFPSRLVSKTFKFRLIYGGSAWAYALDPEFNWISDKPEYWQEIIDEYYVKYKGLKQWHEELVYNAGKSGQYTLPTGRTFRFEMKRNKRGEFELPRTAILNYPVQGLGAEIVAILRTEFHKKYLDLAHMERWQGTPPILLINTVHDSILLDVVNSANVVYNVCDIMDYAVESLPPMFSTIYGCQFDLPFEVEYKMGMNWKDMKEMKTREDIYDYFANFRRISRHHCSQDKVNAGGGNRALSGPEA